MFGGGAERRGEIGGFTGAGLAAGLAVVYRDPLLREAAFLS
jgi:hypothetical protein